MTCVFLPSSSPAGGDPEWRRKPPLRSGTGANQLPISGIGHPNPSFSPAGENVIINSAALAASFRNSAAVVSGYAGRIF